MNTVTFTLSEAEQQRLVDTLTEGNYELRDVDHARIAGKSKKCSLVLYHSGKLVVQGKGSEEWVEFVLEPGILQRTTAITSTAPDIQQPPLPRIGIDESGKGDFFGGMTIAGFRLTRADSGCVTSLGIQDSKRIKSDDRISTIASTLRERGSENCEVLSLPPETYNRLVKKMGSVNRVLAWAHATVLENLLERHPDTSYAVADQFGPEHQIRSALKPKGKAISLEQRHKAESDPAVAAASILARDAFVCQLKELSELTGCRLPLGATHVRPSAEEIVTRAGPEILTRIAKTHFRTTRQVLEATGYDPSLLGTPEPKVWKRK